MPPRLPFDIDYDDDTALRITAYHSPHISGASLVTCMVDMMTQAFAAVWKQNEQHPMLVDHEYVCLKDSLELRIESDQVTAPLEFPDLIAVGNVISDFHQRFIMPGLDFEYWSKGQMIGHGLVRALAATNVKQSLSQE